MGTLVADAYVVTMDGEGSELDGTGFLDVGGGVGLINTHHHLYQTLTRTRAQEADLFTWLQTLYPVWGRIDAASEYAAARAGLAELALSGCSTVFDHHYVFPRGRAGLVEAEIQAARDGCAVRVCPRRLPHQARSHDAERPREARHRAAARFCSCAVGGDDARSARRCVRCFESAAVPSSGRRSWEGPDHRLDMPSTRDRRGRHAVRRGLQTKPLQIGP